MCLSAGNLSQTPWFRPEWRPEVPLTVTVVSAGTTSLGIAWELDSSLKGGIGTHKCNAEKKVENDMKLKQTKNLVKSACYACGLSVLIVGSSARANEATAFCAVEQAIACAPYQACERNLPGAFNIPALIKLDAENSRMTSIGQNGAELTSEISSIVETDADIVLSGADAGQPWAASISKETGRMSATVIQEADTFILFGECSWRIAQ